MLNNNWYKLAEEKTVNEYNILEIPIKKEFQEYSSIEAENYFNWYQSKIRERIEYLFKACSSYNKINMEEICFDKKSLIYIWKWFFSVAVIERKSKIEIRFKKFKEDFSNDDSEKFSIKTEYIIRDIGMYLGEMFVNNHSQIYWTYYTQPNTDFFVNQPLLQGFEDKEFNPPYKMEFEPIHMVGVIAANMFDDTQRVEDLLDLYSQWEAYI